jgi:hypothetical protein
MADKPVGKPNPKLPMYKPDEINKAAAPTADADNVRRNVRRIINARDENALGRATRIRRPVSIPAKPSPHAQDLGRQVADAAKPSRRNTREITERRAAIKPKVPGKPMSGRRSLIDRQTARGAAAESRARPIGNKRTTRRATDTPKSIDGRKPSSKDRASMENATKRARLARQSQGRVNHSLPNTAEQHMSQVSRNAQNAVRSNSTFSRVRAAVDRGVRAVGRAAADTLPGRGVTRIASAVGKTAAGRVAGAVLSKTAAPLMVAQAAFDAGQTAKAGYDAYQAGAAAKANKADMKIRYGTPEAATKTRKSNKKRQELKEAFKLLQK